jgi:hypothetical protein
MCSIGTETTKATAALNAPQMIDEVPCEIPGAYFSKKCLDRSFVANIIIF